MQWWFTHQPTLPGYIFENVPLLGDSRDKVLEGGHYVRQHLGDPIFVDAASIGSYAHRPRWIWTNLAPSSTLAATFSAVYLLFDQKVDDILDPNWTSLPVVRDDLPPLALVNKVGAPRRAFPTFMTFPQSFAFRDRGPGMVWDAHTKIHTEPLADERERAMGFRTGTTAAPGLSEGQRRFVLGQAMDLHTMVWTVSLCLALQRHHGDQLLSLGAEDSGQGVQRSTPMEDGIEVVVGEAERIFRFEQQVMEELRAQQIYTALASSPPVVASSSHIGGDGEGMDSIASTEVGGMVNAPSSQ